MDALIALPSLPRDGRQSDTALRVQRGVGRMLRARGFCMVSELTLHSGRRADVVGLSPSGDIWIVEIKSSIEDFRADGKWFEYRRHCDRLFFATHEGVPPEIFPEDTGFILADSYGGELIRMPDEHRMPAATRKVMLVRFAQAAALRLHGLYDPEAGAAVG